MRVGDWVEVRSEIEILQTLDGQGRLDGMSFMPEMFRFCGQRLQIYKCAHKTCDGISHQSRRLTRTVHLNTRCSGEAHGGCQSACLLFWREEWLRPTSATGGSVACAIEPSQTECNRSSSPSKDDVLAYAVVQKGETVRYRCQATQICDASTRLPWWEMRQYVEDVRSGNVNAWRIACGALSALWLAMSRWRLGVGGLVRWLYDHSRYVWNGGAFPRRVGPIPRGQRTPLGNLNLRPGELVRVRALDEIETTLDTAGLNRGLYFDPEQATYAEGVFRVGDRVERIISEETGRMIHLKTPTVVLDSVCCQGKFSACRMFCPRSARLLWHEAWLERVDKTASHANEEVAVTGYQGRTSDVNQSLPHTCSPACNCSVESPSPANASKHAVAI